MIALLVAGAVSVSAAKKDKAKAEAPKAQPVALKSSSDSLSYAAGYAQTEGLIPFLQQQFKVDTAYMADFIQGLKDAKEKGNDPRFVAYNAGGQIATMIQERMIAGMTRELTDAPDSLVADLFYAGFIGSLQKDTTLFKQTNAMQYFSDGMKRNVEIKNEKLYGKNKKEGAEFLAENAKKDGVITLPSGLQYKVITAGNGQKPVSTDEVEVKYEGKLLDGTVFDSSYKRNPQTTKFKANQVIKGWTEALCLMPVGSKWELYIPADLAYGEHQTGNIPPYSTLIFTVELVGITGAPAPAANAAPVAGNKADAASTAKSAKKPAAKKTTKK